jgi:hypothetical protein
MQKYGVITLLCAMTLTGCTQKTGRVRPDPAELSDNGRGIQGKDVITASDRMATSLLSLPALNASQTQWTIVVDRVENLSQTQRQNFDIFLARLRSTLIRQGQGRVQIVENLQKFRELKSREIEATGDRFGQGGPGAINAPKSIQPDYFLAARLSELPNNETSYFLVDFTLTKVDRTIVWGDMYEVAVNR